DDRQSTPPSRPLPATGVLQPLLVREHGSALLVQRPPLLPRYGHDVQGREPPFRDRAGLPEQLRARQSALRALANGLQLSLITRGAPGHGERWSPRLL